MNNINRAGFIPYIIENGEVYFMLMKPSDSRYGGEDFQIAKGKIEEGEIPIEAAIREAEEELGLRKRNIIAIEHLGKFLGYTDIFYGEVKDQKDFGDTTYETGATTWMTINEFLQHGRYIHRGIIKKFYIEVKELSQRNQTC